jgi:hypothetical protein
MRLDGMKALEIEHRHQKPVAGGITVVISLHVCAHDVRPIRLGVGHCMEGLFDQRCANVGVVKPRRNAVDDRVLERSLIENCRINESRQQRIAGNRFRCLVTHHCPDRIDRLNLRLGNARHVSDSLVLLALGLNALYPHTCAQRNSVFLITSSGGLP